MFKTQYIVYITYHQKYTNFSTVRICLQLFPCTSYLVCDQSALVFPLFFFRHNTCFGQETILMVNKTSENLLSIRSDVTFTSYNTHNHCRLHVAFEFCFLKLSYIFFINWIYFNWNQSVKLNQFLQSRESSSVG